MMANGEPNTDLMHHDGAEGSVQEPAGTRVWSIGIYTGESPLRLAPPPDLLNPVLTARDVTDVPATFVADPFVVRRRGRWSMFFEVWNEQRQRGEIGLAVSDDGRRWRYRQIVLREPYHLSYPYVFSWQEEVYMIPESLAPRAVQLYRADPFPTAWTRVGNLLEGDFADPSIFRFAGRWWLFACSTPFQHSTLRLYGAAELSGPWLEHPRSPIVEHDPCSARPAGRVMEWQGTLLRSTQECSPSYGLKVRAFKITELSRTAYREEEVAESPILSAADEGWNSGGMHHLDPWPLPDGRWMGCVDGWQLIPKRPQNSEEDPWR